MIKIRIDTIGEADALTRSRMEEIAEEYRAALGSLTCPEHHQVPTVVLSGRSPDTISVQMETCCEVLQGFVDEALEEQPES
ncbi:MAG TPA: hypothetical protein VHG08_23745 [Longimicrobium sp.]|nr:hypothetical protein [Longimicrobium sp.]